MKSITALTVLVLSACATTGLPEGWKEGVEENKLGYVSTACSDSQDNAVADARIQIVGHAFRGAPGKLDHSQFFEGQWVGDNYCAKVFAKYEWVR
mgnify:CR=1 FL=1